MCLLTALKRLHQYAAIRSFLLPKPGCSLTGDACSVEDLDYVALKEEARLGFAGSCNGISGFAVFLNQVFTLF